MRSSSGASERTVEETGLWYHVAYNIITTELFVKWIIMTRPEKDRNQKNVLQGLVPWTILRSREG